MKICALKCAFAPIVYFASRAKSALGPGLEYMAQAIGAYAGYAARKRGEPIKLGYLLGTRCYECSRPIYTVGMLLRVHVKRVLQSENGLASFECRIDDEIGQIASANLSVFQPAEDALPDQGTA